MKRWPTVPLRELGRLDRGRSRHRPRDEPSLYGGPYPFIQTGNIANANGRITNYTQTYSDRGLLQSRMWPAGTLCITIAANIAKTAVLTFPACFPDSIVGFTPGNLVLTEFVRYWFLTIQSRLEADAPQAAQRNINLGILGDLDVPLPPVSEQERIVKLLDEADELRKLRAQADRRTDALVPALFHEMFGPQACGSGRWPLDVVGQLAKRSAGTIRTGPFGSDLLHSEFVPEGIPVLGIDNVVRNEFRWTGPRCIPEDKFVAVKRFRVYPGDVLVTIMGTVGRCSVAPDDLPVCISTKHLCTITPDRTRIEPRYLWAAFLFDTLVKSQTRTVSSGAIMEGWNSTIIKRLRVRIPPVKLQAEFATRVAEIRAIEAEQAASRRRLDDLFQSLLHKEFNGEL